MKIKLALIVTLTIFSVIAVVALTSPASWAKGPPDSHGETIYGNNLSVPAIFVPDTIGAPTLRVEGNEEHQAPGEDDVDPTWVEDLDDYYWLQKTEATWTADWNTQDTAIVTAEWGANLTDSPNLLERRPIRVEISLLDLAATEMTGYRITNLTPEEDDRLATYSTRGGETDDEFVTGSEGAPYTRVWDADTTLLIKERQEDGSLVTIYQESPMTAEINSIGAIVYCYNWGSKGRKNMPSAGTYRLIFKTSTATTINDVGIGTVNTPGDLEHKTWVDITLISR
ncbi:hypothetical protein ACFLYF_00950 [Chloroflexota bacterium]